MTTNHGRDGDECATAGKNNRGDNDVRVIQQDCECDHGFSLIVERYIICSQKSVGLCFSSPKCRVNVSAVTHHRQPNFF